jgi:hypothetical protein
MKRVQATPEPVEGPIQRYLLCRCGAGTDIGTIEYAFNCDKVVRVHEHPDRM